DSHSKPASLCDQNALEITLSSGHLVNEYKDLAKIQDLVKYRMVFRSVLLVHLIGHRTEFDLASGSRCVGRYTISSDTPECQNLMDEPPRLRRVVTSDTRLRCFW